MKKYHSNGNEESRVNRNKDLYSKEFDENIDDVNITSNISVINSEKLSEILGDDKKNAFECDFDDIENDLEELENTKEYDLKKVIDEARREKLNDYDEVRFKKIRESEYEILNSLNLGQKNNNSELKDDEETIVDLMKTVSMNENSQKKTNASDDLMSDLIADENTEVIDAMKEDTDFTMPKPTLVEELEKTKQLSKTDIQSSIDEIKDEISDEEEVSEKVLENSFYTGNLTIKDNDLDDFKDLQKELKSGNLFVKLLVLIIVIIVLLVVVFLINKYLDLGLF